MLFTIFKIISFNNFLIDLITCALAFILWNQYSMSFSEFVLRWSDPFVHIKTDAQPYSWLNSNVTLVLYLVKVSRDLLLSFVYVNHLFIYSFIEIIPCYLFYYYHYQKPTQQVHVLKKHMVKKKTKYCQHRTKIPETMISLTVLIQQKPVQLYVVSP